MTTVQILTSLASLFAVIMGGIATYRSSRSEQSKHEGDRFDKYTDRIEKRLQEVETKLEKAEEKLQNAENQIEELKTLRGRDTRWKRVAVRHIEELHNYIQTHLGGQRNDLPILPEELKQHRDQET